VRIASSAPVEQGVGDGVEEERQAREHTEDGTTGRWGGQLHRRRAGHRDAGGVGELGRWDHGPERAAVARAEEDRGGGVGEGDHEDQPERRVVGQDGTGQDGDR